MECLEGGGNAFENFKMEQVLEAVGDGAFADILSNTANKRMVQAFEFYPSTWEKIVNKPFGSRPDFKSNKLVRVEEFQRLEEVTKRNPVKMDTIGEESGTYQVKTYERGYELNRTDIINDDIGAFLKFPASQGKAASRTLDKFVWDFINSNTTMQFDNVALFDSTNHANIITTSPLSTTTLQTADYTLSVQTEKKTGDMLGLTSRWLIVPPSLKLLAQRIVRSTKLQGTTNNDYNPFADLEVLVVPWLTDTGSTTTADWYLAADPSQTETFQLDFLRGKSVPETLKQMATAKDGYNFMTNGLAWKTRYEFGGMLADYRWIVKGDAA